MGDLEAKGIKATTTTAPRTAEKDNAPSEAGLHVESRFCPPDVADPFETVEWDLRLATSHGPWHSDKGIHFCSAKGALSTKDPIYLSRAQRWTVHAHERQTAWNGWQRRQLSPLPRRSMSRDVGSE